jgi:hypothetical protein
MSVDVLVRLACARKPAACSSLIMPGELDALDEEELLEALEEDSAILDWLDEAEVAEALTELVAVELAIDEAVPPPPAPPPQALSTAPVPITGAACLHTFAVCPMVISSGKAPVESGATGV